MRLALVAVFTAHMASGCGRLGFDPTPTQGGADAGLDARPAGIVGWYLMDRLEPGAAGEQLAADTSGHGHDGHCTNCPTIVAGIRDNAFAFDGALQLVQVTSTLALETRAAFTVAAWVRIEAAPATRACAATKGLGTAAFNSWALCVEPDTQLLFFSVTGTTASYLRSTVLVPTAAWHHVAIRWDGVDKSIWLDGVEVASAPAAIDFDDQTIRIGGELDGGSPIAMWPGQIDDLRVHAHALAAVDLAALALP